MIVSLASAAAAANDGIVSSTAALSAQQNPHVNVFIAALRASHKCSEVSGLRSPSKKQFQASLAGSAGVFFR